MARLSAKSEAELEAEYAKAAPCRYYRAFSAGMGPSWCLEHDSPMGVVAKHCHRVVDSAFQVVKLEWEAQGD